MKKAVQNFFFIILIFLLISSVFTLFNPEVLKQEKEITLSQIAQEINNDGNIKQIFISENDLLVLYENGEKAISRKEPDSSLTQSLINYGVSQEKIRNLDISIEKEKTSVWDWLMPILFILPILIFGLFFWTMSKQAKTGASQTFGFLKSPAKLFGGGKAPGEKVSFKDVAGLKEAKEEIKEIVDFLKNPKKFWKMGARIPRGALLIGAPGTGKTLLARAVASESGVPFFSMVGSAFVELFVGVGSSRVRNLFETAKKHQPSIIFIDELDAIGKMRMPGVGGGHEEREQTLNQILAEMDGFERNTGVIIIGASISGDAPVLIKQNGKHKLSTISGLIDPYYQLEEEGIEKNVDGLEVLGFERKIGKGNLLKNNIYFQSSAFKKVRSVFRHKIDTIFEIEYNGGKIKTTGNHSLFVRTPQGIKAKLVSVMKPGEILIDLPYKVNRTAKKFREIRAHIFDPILSLELPVWQPLFGKFEPIRFAHQYALSHIGSFSQTEIAEKFGVSQVTIGRWQRGINKPRALSRNYYKHQNILPEKVKVTPDLMRLFGYFVAEGYVQKAVDFCLNRNEKDKIEDIKNLMKNIFNITPDRMRYATPGAVNIVYFCKPLAEFFAYHCGNGAKNKHVPNFIFEAPFEYFKEFFRGYFAGDGHLHKKTRKGEVTSVSKKLILELNWLFRMHGFKGYIHSFKAKQGRRIRNGKPLKETIAWRLGFGKTQNPLTPDIREKGSVCRPIIKKIKKLPYNGFVYDFCGCENEAFFTGESPILAHNTNKPESLDPALLRPGRFDRRIVLDLPDIKGRQAILKIHCNEKPLALDINLKEIAERTPGFSGADLANLVNEAAILAARRNKKNIYQEELLESIEKVLLGPERKSHILSKKEKKICAFHEAGHALTATLIPKAEKVRKISIVSRGMAAGYTLSASKEEKRIKTKSEFLAELSVLLGGYCAEKLIFKEISTGASNDLEKVSSLARDLVTKYGMSKLGPISFGKRESSLFLGWEEEVKRNYSERIASEIDKETKRFIREAENKTTKLLKKKKKMLKKIADVLIEKETIEKEEFEDLLKRKKNPPTGGKQRNQKSNIGHVA